MKTLLPADKVLTSRRMEILKLSANGYTNAYIARALGLSEETVKSHMKIIKAGLGARDRTHAAVIAVVRGLIHPHEIELSRPKEPR